MIRMYIVGTLLFRETLVKGFCLSLSFYMVTQIQSSIQVDYSGQSIFEKGGFFPVKILEHNTNVHSGNWSCGHGR